MRVLVVGGAGFIGSHLVRRLRGERHYVTVLDNLSGGYSHAVGDTELVVADICNKNALEKLFSTHEFDVVVHFASLIQVGESVIDPARYYVNNVSGSVTLLECMRKHNVLNLVFSSTAAVYGLPKESPITENHPTNPINPYGKSKLMIENIIDDFATAYGIKAVKLRYFNAAGAAPDGLLGEMHEPETHLIPLILQAASGRRSRITVFGTDYDTPDGTCIRDYVHVEDLVTAHLLAIDFINSHGSCGIFNLGNGNGFSVNEIIECARTVTGQAIQVELGPRREGDPPILIADASKAKDELRWRPKYSDIESIVSHAWQWEVNRFTGRTDS
jgi:UDP-glucose 4-epimerase